MGMGVGVGVGVVVGVGAVMVEVWARERGWCGRRTMGAGGLTLLGVGCFTPVGQFFLTEFSSQFAPRSLLRRGALVLARRP